MEKTSNKAIIGKQLLLSATDDIYTRTYLPIYCELYIIRLIPN